MKNHIRVIITLGILVLIYPPVFLHAQVEITGDLAVTASALDRDSHVNTNFRGDSPFDLTRLRLFVRTQATENIGVYAEIFLDNEAPVRMNGAYLYIRDIIQDRLDLKVGMLPAPFGNYGLRSTYFNLNPFIGVPALWHYKTGLRTDQYVTNEDLIDESGKVLTNRWGAALGYDACWDIGVEALFFWSGFELSGAVTAGTMGVPQARFNNGYQVVVKASVLPTDGVRFGASFAQGPYMVPSTNSGAYLARGIGLPDPNADAPEDQTTFGLHGEWLFGHWQWFGEAVQVDYDAPYVFEKKLTIHTAYLEGRWDFMPGLYLAGRYDLWRYDQIAPFASGMGGIFSWGNNFNRIESALGWRINRQTLLKLDFQYWDYLDESDLRLVALQLHLAF